MNVFEDLIVELKEQNLLEETILDFDQLQIELDDVGDLSGSTGNARTWDEHVTAPKAEVVKKRISEQMVALQMVDHVFTGAERDFLKTEPQVFDDLPAKKALHRYVQASKSPDTDDYFEAESKLLLEMEAWTLALTARDGVVAVAALRRYCETAQPPLSPQALFSLARFYLALEPSDETVKKFDFVVTRLFSKIEDGGQRSLICSRDEIVGHLKKRYSDWAVVQPGLQGAAEHDVTTGILNLKQLITEAEEAATLDDLKGSGFFERVCKAKEEAAGMYFRPQFTATVIDCNIALANRVTDLLQSEKHRLGDPEKVLQKFATLDQFLVSDSVGRTFSFKQALDYDLGADPFDLPLDFAKATGDKHPNASKDRVYSRPYSLKKRDTTIFGLNRWLVVGCILALTLAASFYLWGENLFADNSTVATAKSIDLQDPELKEYAKTVKLSHDMIYVITTPAFTDLARDKQEEYLRKLQSVGSEKGFTKVSLMNERGKNIAYASPEKIQLNEDVPAAQ